MNGAKVSKNMSIAAGILGIILLACGLACCICGFVWISFGGGAHGIWSGIALLVTGALGVVVLVTKSRPVMVFFLVFNIIDLIINIIQAIVAAIIAALIGILKKALDDGKCDELNNKCHCSVTDSGLKDTSWEIEGCDDIDRMHAIFQAIVAFSVIGIIVTFTGSIIGCIGACCDKSQNSPGVVVMQPGNPPGQMQTTTVQSYTQQPYPAQQPNQPQPYQQQPYQQQPYPPPGPAPFQPTPTENTAEMGAVY